MKMFGQVVYVNVNVHKFKLLAIIGGDLLQTQLFRTPFPAKIKGLIKYLRKELGTIYKFTQHTNCVFHNQDLPTVREK